MESPLSRLEEIFGSRLQQNVRMAHYTTSRVGGEVTGLLPINTLDEMRQAATELWAMDMPFHVLGSGSNVLVSDKGYQGVMLLNHCHNVKIKSDAADPYVYAESGANMGAMARQAALRGLSGLEWAGPVPGTVGGAVYGNAGAHGSDVSKSLRFVSVLFKEGGEQELDPEGMGYKYRSSQLKRERIPAVILAATFNAQISTREEAWGRLGENLAYRQGTQPPGNSTGSTFRNPPGDHAGRLIEAAGLKGTRIGGAEFSTMHANFIVNDGHATAQDYYSLISLAKREVKEQFGVDLRLEIELLGEFDD